MNGITQKAGIALVLVASTLWATVGIAAQLVPAAAGMPPEALGLARTAIAGPVILLVALAALGRAAVLATRLNPAALTLFAVSNAVFQIGLFQCFLLLGVTVTVFLTVCLPPVLAMFLNWLLQREPVTPGSVVALVHAVAGLWFIAGDRALGAAETMPAEGLVIALVASFAFVTMSEAARSLGRTAPPLMIAGTGLSLSSLVLLAMTPIVSPTSLAPLGAAFRDPAALGLLLYLGLGPTALAYVCYCTGIAGCRSALVALIASMIEPAVAAVLAICILSDSPTLSEAVGCTLLMMAMVVLWHSERSLARRRVLPETDGPGRA